MNKSYLIILLTILFTGCYSGVKDSERLNSERMKDFELSTKGQIVVDNNAEIKIDPSQLDLNKAKTSKTFRKRRYLELKTPNDVLIGGVSKIKTNDDLILILDERISKAAYLFNSLGEYLFTVGSKGGGPGEHDDPIAIELTDSRIILVDRQFTVHEYSLQNQFISKQDIPFFSHSVFAFSNNSLAFSNNTTGYEDLSYQIILIDGQEISLRALKNKGGAISRYTSQQLSNNQEIHGDSFLFTEPWGTNIYQMSSSTIQSRYNIISDNPIDESLLNDDNRLAIEQYSRTFLYNWPILESETLTMMRVLHRNKLMTVFHNKQTNEIKAYNGISDDILYGGIMDFPVYVNKNDYYIPLNVEQMYAAKQEIAAIKDEKLLSELKEARPEVFSLFDKITEFSNPILMICEIY